MKKLTPLGISDIPWEILLHIIQKCLLPKPSLNDNPRYTDPGRYATVCRFWRAVILSSPGLWSTIRIHENSSPGEPHFDPKRVAAEFRRCQLHLDRSQSMPLTLRIWTFFPHPSLEVMVSHSNRWKNVKIESTHEALETMLFSSNGSPWPLAQLECLKLINFKTEWESGSDTVPEGQNPETSARLDSLAHAPALKVLYLVSIDLSKFEFSWPQLRDLTLDAIDFDIVRAQEILEQCSSLERLTLNVIITTGDDQDYLNESPNLTLNGVLEFPKLTYLSVELYESDRILTQFRAPILTELIIEDIPQFCHLASFLRTSGEHIKHLTLEQFAIKEDADVPQLGPAFRHLSNLESLSVSFAVPDDDGHDGLWGPEAVSQLLDVLTFRRDLAVAPNLATLDLFQADIKADSFIKMVSSRVHSSHPDAHQPNTDLIFVYVVTNTRSTRKLFTKTDMARLKELTGGMQTFQLVDGAFATSSAEGPGSEEEPLAND